MSSELRPTDTTKSYKYFLNLSIGSIVMQRKRYLEIIPLVQCAANNKNNDIVKIKLFIISHNLATLWFSKEKTLYN